jgi:hypothetical protein
VARIFISHTSQNNDHAVQLHAWLVANGWDDFFFDLDPEHGIAAGELWKKKRQEAAQRCLAVSGIIETTVKHALAELPKNKAQPALIRMAFLPHLARVTSHSARLLIPA